MIRCKEREMSDNDIIKDIVDRFSSELCDLLAHYDANIKTLDRQHLSKIFLCIKRFTPMKSIGRMTSDDVLSAICEELKYDVPDFESSETRKALDFVFMCIKTGLLISGDESLVDDECESDYFDGRDLTEQYESDSECYIKDDYDVQRDKQVAFIEESQQKLLMDVLTKLNDELKAARSEIADAQVDIAELKKTSKPSVFGPLEYEEKAKMYPYYDNEIEDLLKKRNPDYVGRVAEAMKKFPSFYPKDDSEENNSKDEADKSEENNGFSIKDEVEKMNQEVERQKEIFKHNNCPQFDPLFGNAIDPYAGCPCRVENGGSGICGCVMPSLGMFSNPNMFSDYSVTSGHDMTKLSFANDTVSNVEKEDSYEEGSCEEEC